jgi:CAAX protease family protein
VGGCCRPNGVLAWIVAPWPSHHRGGRDTFIEALLICFNTGLVWMLVLTLILVRREQVSLEWSRVRSGKVWWWVVPFTVFAAAQELAPIDPQGPLPRDLPKAIQTDRVEHFFSGAWGWFALAVMVVFLAPLVEELLFRGLLLPRMRTAFGKRDWVANGTLFTLYHVHQPWSMPATLVDGSFAAAYPTKRYRSTWMGVVTHTLPSFIITGAILSLVLK